jgi:Cys-rich four helix bundle protein (predicted Tat secretion target)
MQRRKLISAVTSIAAIGFGSMVSGRAAAQANAEHDHKAMMAGQSATKPRRYDELVEPFQACSKAVAVCISHCQTLLATGDRSLGRCLRTALDCDVVCNAALRAALINSNYTPSLARTAVAAMDACVKACKPHIEHHVECKACHDACLAAIDAAKKLA